MRPGIQVEQRHPEYGLKNATRSTGWKMRPGVRVEECDPEDGLKIATCVSTGWRMRPGVQVEDCDPDTGWRMRPGVRVEKCDGRLRAGWRMRRWVRVEECDGRCGLKNATTGTGWRMRREVRVYQSAHALDAFSVSSPNSLRNLRLVLSLHTLRFATRVVLFDRHQVQLKHVLPPFRNQDP